MENFDQVISRIGTNSIKWDEIKTMYHEEDLLPLWIADMDFKAPTDVLQAFENLVQQGILGYSGPSSTLFQAIIDWQAAHHEWHIEQEDILFFTGVLAGMTTALQALSEPGDSVLIFDPVYPPFASIVENNQRRLIRSSLIENETFSFDFTDLEYKIKTENVKILLLCNPHNPGGRVWSKQELHQLGNLCQKYQVIVFSDEIHQDLVFAPHQLTTFANAGDNFADFSLTFTSMTKTFNLAGIKNSFLVIKNPELRQKVATKQQKNFQQEINVFGYTGMEAAYRFGESWRKELLTYLQQNIQLAIDFFHAELPKVTIMSPEGTYLLWLDFSAYGLTDEQLEQKMIHEAKVVLNSGLSYGPSGSQHMRLNVACPKATLLTGLKRIKKVFAN